MDQVTVGATRKDFVFEVVDANDQPINVTGGTFRLQGVSADITKTIDVAGTITDGANGIVTWSGVGGTGYLQESDMGAHLTATYTFKVKWTDVAAKVDWSTEFQWQYVMKPAV